MTTQLSLTEPEYKTFEFIRSYMRHCSQAPTIAEIATDHRVSATTISTRLKALESKSWITRQRYKARSIQIVKREEQKVDKKGNKRRDPRYDVTIVRVNKTYNMVTVDYNGLEHSYAPTAITPDELVNMYISRGFKYCPLPGNVILLTRKTARAAWAEVRRRAA